MAIEQSPHEWSKDALFPKVQRYLDEMQSSDHDEWQFGLWSALALELLIRSALAHVSPALLADGREWSNILYAVGKQPNQKKFNPKSAEISTLLTGLESTFPEFTKEMLDFSLLHISKRNSEIHSGALPFDNVGTSSWLPMYYSVCECLLRLAGENLESVFDKATAKEVKEHIKAGHDEAAKTVRKNIAAHATMWSEFTEAEQQELRETANTASTRHYGHRVICPACGSTALVHGSPAGVPKREFDEFEIIEKQRMLPASFECVACKLKIAGYSKLVACGLGDAFSSVSGYGPIEFFNIDIRQEYQEMMADDFNE